MKKFILAIMALIILVLATLVLFDALTMKSEAAQVGVRITQQIPQHGHSNMYDGGILNMPSFASYQSGTQIVTSNTWTIIQIDTLAYTAPTFSTTVHRHTPNVAGKYVYSGQLCSSSSGTTTAMQILLYKNGNPYVYAPFTANGTWGAAILNCVITPSTVITMNGTTDYVELYGLTIGSGTITEQNAFFSGYQVTR